MQKEKDKETARFRNQKRNQEGEKSFTGAKKNEYVRKKSIILCNCKKATIVTMFSSQYVGKHSKVGKRPDMIVPATTLSAVYEGREKQLLH